MSQCTAITRAGHRCKKNVSIKGAPYGVCSIHYPQVNPSARCRVLTQEGNQCLLPISEKGKSISACLIHTPAFSSDTRCRGTTLKKERCRNSGKYSGYCHFHKSQDLSGKRIVIIGSELDLLQSVQISPVQLERAKFQAAKSKTPNEILINLE